MSVFAGGRNYARRGEARRGGVTLQALYMLFYGLFQLGLMINLQSKDT